MKHDNIVIKEKCGRYDPIIIDFGKMKKITEAKKYNLTQKEQGKYSKFHKHIAPEIVSGKSPPSAASDIFSLGRIISLVVHYNPSPELQNIAKACKHGTPEERPKLGDIIFQIDQISQIEV